MSYYTGYLIATCLSFLTPIKGNLLLNQDYLLTTGHFCWDEGTPHKLFENKKDAVARYSKKNYIWIDTFLSLGDCSLEEVEGSGDDTKASYSGRRIGTRSQSAFLHIYIAFPFSLLFHESQPLFGSSLAPKPWLFTIAPYILPFIVSITGQRLMPGQEEGQVVVHEVTRAMNLSPHRLVTRKPAQISGIWIYG